MRVEIESFRMSDQTSEEWKQQACPVVGEAGEQTHSMVSVKVASELIRYVEQCEFCGWIDPVALTFQAENAFKTIQTKRAQRIAVATETNPFAFVQPSSGELDIREILTQALAAAFSIGLTEGFADRRMAEILDRLFAEVQRYRQQGECQVMGKLQQERAEQVEGQVP